MTRKDLLEQASFTFDSYQIFVKQFPLCRLKVTRVIISNERNQNEECHVLVIYSMTVMKKYLYTSLHRIMPVLLAC